MKLTTQQETTSRENLRPRALKETASVCQHQRSESKPVPVSVPSKERFMAPFHHNLLPTRVVMNP